MTSPRAVDPPYDVAVLGGGSAGYAAARTAAGQGMRVVVVEGGEEIGGLCILRGCMPTKALLYAAEVMHLAGRSHTWGIQARDLGFDFGRVMARKDAMVRDFASFREQQLRSGKFDFVRDRARFLDAGTLGLEGGRRICARHFVVASGSRLAPAPLAVLDEVGYLSSDSALRLQRLPKSIVVLGGGAVALEFAQFFARFGVDVTLAQRSPRVLHSMDPDLSRVIEAVLRREGVRLFTGTTLLNARMLGGKKEVEFEHEGERVKVLAEEIFFGLGRVPNTADLGLEGIGIELVNGLVPTDTAQRTSLPHIFAAGDCAGPFEIVHLAVLQGEIAGHNITHPDRLKQMDYRLLMETIFTEPQLATVGLTELEAVRHDLPYLVASYSFHEHGKSMIMEALDGFVKLLADPVTGEILGGACVGPVAGELIHEITAAMHKRMTVAELAAMPHYHPTLAEIWTYPAEELAAQISPPAT